MKRISVLPVLIVMACVLASFKPGSNKWKTYKPNNEHYSIVMPGEPEVKVQMMETLLGDVKMTLVKYQPEKGTDDNTLYTMLYSDYPENRISSDSGYMMKTFFETATEGIVKNIKGNLITQTEISYKGFPGRQILMDINEGKTIVSCKAYLVKGRFYIMQVMTPADRIANKSITKFLDSFTLEDKK